MITFDQVNFYDQRFVITDRIKAMKIKHAGMGECVGFESAVFGGRV